MGSLAIIWLRVLIELVHIFFEEFSIAFLLRLKLFLVDFAENLCGSSNVFVESFINLLKVEVFFV